MKSKTVTKVFDSCLRNPRPSCWMKIIGELVGLSIKTALTLGMSIPSLKTSTENITSSVPASSDSKLAIALIRSLTEVSPLIKSLRMPRALNSSFMYCACSWLAQKPRAFNL